MTANEMIGAVVLAVATLSGLYFTFKNSSDKYANKDELKEIKKDMATKSDIELIGSQIVNSNELLNNTIKHSFETMEQSLNSERENRARLEVSVLQLTTRLRDFENIMSIYEHNNKRYKERSHGN